MLETPTRDRVGRPMSSVQVQGYWLGKRAPNAGKKYPAEPLSREEVDAVIAACGRGKAGLRNRAELRLAHRTGLRDMELRGLEIRDVDLAAGELRVREGKGRKPRVLGFDDEVAAVLDRWLHYRARLGVSTRSGPLFCTITLGAAGRPLSPSYMRGLCPKLAKLAGVSKRVHMHGFRHTWAYERLREGWPLDLIKAGLGHSSMRTTERYAFHLRPAELVDAMRGKGWTGGQPAEVVNALSKPGVAEALAAVLAGLSG